MKTFTIAAVTALMAAVAQAAPAPSVKEARQSLFSITFLGAGPNPPSYTIEDAGQGDEFPIGTMLHPSLALILRVLDCLPIESLSTSHDIQLFLVNNENLLRPSSSTKTGWVLADFRLINRRSTQRLPHIRCGNWQLRFWGK